MNIVKTNFWIDFLSIKVNSFQLNLNIEIQLIFNLYALQVVRFLKIFTKTHTALLICLGQHNRPSKDTIKRIFETIQRTGSVEG